MKQYKIPAIVCSVLCIFVLLFNLISVSSFAVTNYIYSESEGYYSTPNTFHLFEHGESFNSSTPVGTVDYSLDDGGEILHLAFSFDQIIYSPDSLTFNIATDTAFVFTPTMSVSDVEIRFESSFTSESVYNYLDTCFSFVPSGETPVDPPAAETVPLVEGYYQFRPITTSTFDPSFIGVGNTISFTNMTDMYAVFQYGARLHIDKLSLSLRQNNAIVYLDTYIESDQWVDPILIARTSLPAGSSNGTTSLPVDTAFNPSMGPFLYFEVNNDLFEVDDNTWNLLDDLLSYSSSPPPTTEQPVTPEPPPSEWDENPFVMILSMIIDALQVPLFGYFSPFDIFICLLGIFITIWLLKFIAGG